MLANLGKEFEDIKKFKEEVRGSIKSRGKVIKNLEYQVGHLSQQILKPTDSFPSDTEKILRGEMKKVRWEECKAVTLANEEILEEDTNKLTEHNQGSFQSNLEEKEQGTRSMQRKGSTREEMLEPYLPRAPFPQRLRGGDKEMLYSRFLDMFASPNVNIPYREILKQMPTCIKWMKELLARKSNLKGGQTVVMNKECSAFIQKDVLLKIKDPGSFHIPCTIGETIIDRGFYDLGASINVMPLSLMKKLQINEVRATDVIIQLVDKTQKQAEGIVENVLVKVRNYFLPTDFVILTMEESHIYPIILGRPFLATGRALIDVEQGELILRIHDEQLTFKAFKPGHESEQERKKLKEEYSEISLKENSNEPPDKHLELSLMDKQGAQEMKQPMEFKKELKPQESGRAANKDLPNTTRVNGALMEEEKRVVKKLPRGWRNKKVSIEGFSPGDKVISIYHPPIPPSLPTIPSQLPQVFTIRKALSLEHLEIIKESSGESFTVRGEDLKHYNPP
ncbi:hypothetical protein Ahy_B01g054394 [Arachis hypogaea]|uniref:Aspartic peptidase DDI1-type domain-containing protein n=1 Tax=Arachis hypogaea TaxID=3818 RepID=A0A445ATT6_ARAHY|nr:hypothetical protein Ahy_B01g054394 [Arachis hypogaea]